MNARAPGFIVRLDAGGCVAVRGDGYAESGDGVDGPRTVMVGSVGGGREPVRFGAQAAAWLARAYAADPDRFPRGIDGAFAAAVIDEPRRRLVAAADPFGARRIYWTRAETGEWAVANDLRHLVAGDFQRRVNLRAVYDYLNFLCFPGPETVWEDAWCLEPGMRLDMPLAAAAEGDAVERLIEVWRPAYPADAALGADAAASELRKAMWQSVAWAVGDTPRDRSGVFLSGGTDSSTLVAAMSAAAAGAVRTFAGGFAEEGYSELRYARLCAEIHATEHHECMTQEGDAVRVLEHCAELLEQPHGNASFVPTFVCARAAADAGVACMIGGDGGDELFGGNERYRKNAVMDRYRRVPGPLRRLLIEPIVQALPERGFAASRLRNFVRRANLDNPERFFSDDSFGADHRETWVGEAVRAAAPAAQSLDAMRRAYPVEARGEINRMLALDLRFAIFASDLPKVVQACLACGMEPLFPMLNLTLFDLAAAWPPKFKLRGLEKRYVFKRMMRAFMPKEIIEKPKHGFALPVSLWLRRGGPLLDAVSERILDAGFRARGILAPGAAEFFLDQHRRGAWDWSHHLWSWALLAAWLDAQEAVSNEKP